MNLIAQLEAKNIFIADSYDNTDQFYSDYAAFLKENNLIKDNDNVKRLFIKRENIQSTAIGKGAAAPHIFSNEFPEFLFSVALIRQGMDFKSPDGNNIFLVFLIMSDERDVGLHLKSLAHIARLVNCTEIVEESKKSGNPQELLKIIQDQEKLI